MNFLGALGLAIASSSLVPDVYAIDTITRAGRYLYNSTGRFYIKGVAYQQQGAVASPGELPTTFIDSLADGTACSRDLPFLQQLGVNAIRAYSVDSNQNHDACMQAFSNAGIYTIIDLSLPINGSIDSNAPGWTSNLLDLYLGTITEFLKYDNVLAFNIGNEVVSLVNQTDAAPFVKAAARDIKSFLASKSSGALVGYASIDGAANFKIPLAEFMSCDPTGSNSGTSALDLYGLNNYEWCGDSTFQNSYAGTEADFANYNIPAYFSEFGCITSPPRLWTETQSLFSSQMSDVWSGGLAFSYFPASVGGQGQFGMVNISSDGSTVTPNDDFTRLAQQYGQISPPNTPPQSSAGSTSYPTCPSANSTLLASSTLPPTPNDNACSCVQSVVSCQFTPKVSDTTAIVGVLTGAACSLLGQAGGNCDALTGNGTSGTYGIVAACDPETRLSYAMTEYYESQNRNANACSFSGNGTINSRAASSSAGVVAAASSCLASATGVSTPSSTASGSGGGGSSSSASGSSGSKSGAILNHPMSFFVSLAVVLGSVLAGGWATLM